MEAAVKKERVHEVVRTGYAQIAKQGNTCCGPSGSGGVCGSATEVDHRSTASRIGYSEADVTGPAAEANLGLGCGNPTALAGLCPGEVVVDLGSGAGFDALLCAQKLGPEGRFIGVDMTPEMLERARTNAVRAGYARTVEFREGLIESLPVASESVDVVISNCVINLSPDKPKVFREAHRVLKPGGRLAVSDVILTEPLPKVVAELAATWIACVGGASTEEEYLGHMRAAGFDHIEYTREPAAALLAPDLQDPLWKEVVATLGREQIEAVSATVFSYSITARKP